MLTIQNTAFIISSVIAAGASAAANNPKLAWDPNNEANLAGYKVYFGTSSRGCIGDPVDERFVYSGGAALQGGSPIVIFQNELTDPANPTYVLAGLPLNVNKFTVTAFDTSDQESRYSDEVHLATAQVPPSLCDVSAESSTNVVVSYSQFVDQATATNLANYSLKNLASNSLTPISGITFDPNFKRVTLTTGALQNGANYQLIVNGVKDFFDPVLIATNSQKTFTFTTAPSLRSARPLNHAPPNLEIEFNKNVAGLSANIASNYTLLDVTTSTNLGVVSATRGIDRNYADNERVVDLSAVSPLVEGHHYRLTVNNVADPDGHAIVANSTLEIDIPVDTTPPKALSAHVTNPLKKRNEVHVVFDEEIDATTATALTNYAISNGININSASALGDHKTVVLLTSNHIDGRYQISISGIRDNSAAQNLMTPTALNYRVIDTVTDTDGDGREDVRDNCPLIANPDQRDTDGDGFGNRCDADFNNDGNVNAIDLAIFKQAFGKTTNPNADLNGDGRVNAIDLAIFKQLFGKKLF